MCQSTGAGPAIPSARGQLSGDARTLAELGCCDDREAAAYESTMYGNYQVQLRAKNAAMQNSPKKKPRNVTSITVR